MISKKHAKANEFAHRTIFYIRQTIVSHTFEYTTLCSMLLGQSVIFDPISVVIVIHIHFYASISILQISSCHPL